VPHLKAYQKVILSLGTEFPAFPQPIHLSEETRAFTPLARLPAPGLALKSPLDGWLPALSPTFKGVVRQRLTEPVGPGANQQSRIDEPDLRIPQQAPAGPPPPPPN